LQSLKGLKATDAGLDQSYVGGFYTIFCFLCDLLAGEEGFEPSNAGIKIQCLNRLGDSPTQPIVRRLVSEAAPATASAKFINIFNVKPIPYF
jgi:hypothetical protein